MPPFFLPAKHARVLSYSATCSIFPCKHREAPFSSASNPLFFMIPVLILQFRGRIQDILPDLPAQHDHYLLRWLRGETDGLKHTHTHSQKLAQATFCVFSTTVPQRLKFRLTGPNTNRQNRSRVGSRVSGLLGDNLPPNWAV